MVEVRDLAACRRPAQLGPQPAPLAAVEAVRVERQEEHAAVGEAVVQPAVRQREEAQVVLQVVVVVVADAGPERLRGDQVAQRAEHEPPVLVLGAVDLRVVAGRDREVDGRVGRQAAQVRARGGRADAEVADHAEREPVRRRRRACGSADERPELAVGLPAGSSYAVPGCRLRHRHRRGGGSASASRCDDRERRRPPGPKAARSWPARRSAIRRSRRRRGQLLEIGADLERPRRRRRDPRRTGSPRSRRPARARARRTRTRALASSHSSTNRARVGLAHPHAVAVDGVALELPEQGPRPSATSGRPGPGASPRRRGRAARRQVGAGRRREAREHRERGQHARATATSTG